MKRRKDIYFRKKKRVPKGIIALAVIVVSAALAAGGYFTAKSIAEAREERAEIGKCTWNDEGFENVSDIKSFGEKIAVFTDKSTGKLGLMTFEGEITEEANYDSFYICSDVWGSKKYIAEGGGSEYPRLVDVLDGKVTVRQYHSAEKPEKSACWSQAAKGLVWMDSKGYAGHVKKSEIGSAQGLIPVSTSLDENAKWGFVDSNLNLKITLTYDSVCEFSNGLAAVESGGKWGYITENEIIKIPPAYESAADENVGGKDCSFGFRNGLAPVKKGGKFGIIDKSGNTVVNFAFDKIIQGKDGKYLAFRNGSWGLITVDEEKVSETSAPAIGTTTKPVVVYDLGEFTVRTSGNPLNLRRDANTDSVILRKIPDGTVLTVEKSTAGWGYVEFDGVKGWVSMKYLVKQTETTKIS